MAAPRLTLVHRRDCALCDEMLAQLEALGRTVALPPLELLDVDSDPLLRRRHGLDVPVVCRHRLDRGELARLLRPGRGAHA